MATAKIARTQTQPSRTQSDGKRTTSKPSPRGRQGSVFHQRLAALTYHQACQMLGDDDSCDAPCHHVGAALGYLLDAKSVLGLAAPPDKSVPLENLTEKKLLDNRKFGSRWRTKMHSAASLRRLRNYCRRDGDVSGTAVRSGQRI